MHVGVRTQQTCHTEGLMKMCHMTYKCMSYITSKFRLGPP